MQWAAAPQGFDLVMRPGGPGKLKVGYVATLERWPAALRRCPSARPT